MTDPSLLELADTIATSYELTALALSWQIADSIVKSHPDADKSEIYENPWDYIMLSDENIHAYAEHWFNEENIIEGHAASMQIIKVFWRACGIMHNWMDMALKEELTIDTMPRPDIVITDV